jgi:hypothetical protein
MGDYFFSMGGDFGNFCREGSIWSQACPLSAKITICGVNRLGSLRLPTLTNTISAMLVVTQ